MSGDRSPLRVALVGSSGKGHISHLIQKYVEPDAQSVRLLQPGDVERLPDGPLIVRVYPGDEHLIPEGFDVIATQPVERLLYLATRRDGSAD